VAGEVELRFYAELVDLLASERRGRPVAYRFDVAPTVKDAIESLGVPHTEVDLVLADGEPVGWDHRLTDGERIAVFPVFEALDVGPVGRLRPEPLREPRFVADVHLATLARDLRLLGFDTLYGNDWDDDRLARLSVDEHRTLLTRDRGLLKRRAITHGVLVRADHPDDQVVEVLDRLQLGNRARPFTRCLACNATPEDVDTATVAARVPADVVRSQPRVRECPGCKRVYWRGSHSDRLAARVEAILGR
jgi:uncharacterized protein